VFDRTSYPPAEDPLAYCLARIRVGAGPGSPGWSGERDAPGVDVALILDVSGSMDKPNRYPLLCGAVRRLVTGLGPHDWVSVILFTDRSKTVFPFMPVEEVATEPERIIQAMNESGLLFGPRTNLAPGLRLALDGFRSHAASGGRVRRSYILTDGELHDAPECELALDGFRPESIEVHIYGFGDGFDAVALKRLVSDQIGGTVKPIINEEDITQTFAHVAEVNRRLIGNSAKLEVHFAPEVTCGDAWVFQPHGRYLGAVRDRRIEHVIGGIEAGRWYSLLLELRLAPRLAAVGTAEISWIARDERVSKRAEIVALRAEGAGDFVPEVRQALEILQALRAGNDAAAELASYKARRELAILEMRDPELIAALDKMIASIIQPQAEPKQAGTTPNSSRSRVAGRVERSALDEWTALIQQKTARAKLTERERLILDSDTCTAVLCPTRPREFPEISLMYDLMDVLAGAVESASSDYEALERGVLASQPYIAQGYEVSEVGQVLFEYCGVIGASTPLLFRLMQRHLGSQ
jgi:von Willebrand factor type A domain